MAKTTMNPAGLPVPRGSYSLVAIAQPGRMVFIAGQTASDPQGNVVGIGDVRAQTRYILDKIKRAVEAAGGCTTRRELYWSFAIAKCVRMVFNGSQRVGDTVGNVVRAGDGRAHPSFLIDKIKGGEDAGGGRLMTSSQRKWDTPDFGICF